MDFHEAEKGFSELAGREIRQIVSAPAGAAVRATLPHHIQLLIWCCQLPPRFSGQFHRKTQLMAKTVDKIQFLKKMGAGKEIR